VTKLTTPEQERATARVVAGGRRLRDARSAVRKAKAELLDAVDEAEAAHVPMRQLAQQAGVQRSLIYLWREQREAAA
jgi:hypothetical protein